MKTKVGQCLLFSDVSGLQFGGLEMCDMLKIHTFASRSFIKALSWRIIFCKFLPGNIEIKIYILEI